jgi:hypothetical protein
MIKKKGVSGDDEFDALPDDELENFGDEDEDEDLLGDDELDEDDELDDDEEEFDEDFDEDGPYAENEDFANLDAGEDSDE